MNENYRILGLTETASDEEIKDRYSELKKKYNEERWLDGEAGNEAARMLGKIDAAYVEIMAERREKERNEQKNPLTMAADAIANGDLVKAQIILDECNERTAEWHYLQAKLFFRKNWINESKKQMEIALQLEPNNTKYKEIYDKLLMRTQYRQQSGYQTPYGAPAQDQQADQQMGGNGCSQCIECCYTYMCINCLFNLCCGCR